MTGYAIPKPIWEIAPVKSLARQVDGKRAGTRIGQINAQTGKVPLRRLGTGINAG